MSEWRDATLNQLGSIVTGKTPKSSHSEYFGGNTPFVTPRDYDGRRKIETTERYLTEKGINSVRNACIPQNAVMVSCIGSDMGKTALAPRDVVTNQQINSIVIEPGTDPLFVYYNLSNRKAELRAAAGGSAQPILNKSDFGRFNISLPPLPEQRAIAHILGTLDDKIELNRRMNQTLEAMARALFKSWFVDFDPVRAKMEGRDTGLPQHIADLFPDRMVDSELGEIPEGWRFFRLDELADHHTQSIAPSSCPESVFEHFSIPAHDAGQMPAIERGTAIKSNKTVVPPDAVLLSKLNPEIPRVWMPDTPNERLQICSTEFLTFTPRRPANRSLLFSLFTDANFRRILRSMVTGTSKSHQRVPAAALKGNKVLSGTPKVFNMFDALAAPMLNRVIRNRTESYILAAIRNTLLPKLVSGELRVPDAEFL